MPKHGPVSIMMFVSLVAVLMAAQRAEDFDSSGSARRPAQVRSKQSVLRGGDVATIRHTEKLRGPLTATIEMMGQPPQSAGDVFVLRAEVNSREELSKVDFVWDIPAGIEPIKGALSGVISPVAPNQPAYLEVTLKSLKDGNQQVHLMVRGESGGAKFAESAQYNTLTEPELRAQNKERAKATRSQSLDNPSDSKPKFKIFD